MAYNFLTNKARKVELEPYERTFREVFKPHLIFENSLIFGLCSSILSNHEKLKVAEFP